MPEARPKDTRPNKPNTKPQPNARPSVTEAPFQPEAILERLRTLDRPAPLKPSVALDDLVHRHLLKGRFWTRIPAFADVSEELFLDFKWQNKHAATSFEGLKDIIEPLVAPQFLSDVASGLAAAPMLLRLSPYLLSLIDWDAPYDDPIRRQFIPVQSKHVDDHPMLTLDSLSEQDDSPVQGLVHRYQDKALFLALDVCPVYCRFCTRSYAIGGDTDSVEKVSYKPMPKSWDKAFAYLLSRPEVEDVVVSGGDAFFLPANRLRHIGETLLAVPHIRRIRLATKGPAVMPMKILSDHAWRDAVIYLSDLGRSLGKEVCLHTHFNHPREITEITERAMVSLFSAGVKVRNQSVLIRGVNDRVDTMQRLVKRLSYINVQPYYVYQHDMVKGVEDLRTPIHVTVELERAVRGVTAGFNTPLFVTDAPGGGGKRDVHSYDYYDRTTGISVYRSPSVDDSRVHLYFDPIDTLPPEGQARWADPEEHEAMKQEALEAAGFAELEVANG
jgi:lysine 2,3-aminomutase